MRKVVWVKREDNGKRKSYLYLLIYCIVVVKSKSVKSIKIN